jgi:hypothetical protein
MGCSPRFLHSLRAEPGVPGRTQPRLHHRRALGARVFFITTVVAAMVYEPELPDFTDQISSAAWVAAEICRRRQIPLESSIAGRVFDLVWEREQVELAKLENEPDAD